MSFKYKSGDIVLAKIGSYPKWPAIVVPLRYVPKGVWKQKKNDRYCVAFFNDPTFFWSSEKALWPLKNAGEVNTNKLKDKDLAGAYKEAAKCEGLEHFLRNIISVLEDDEVFEHDELCFYTKDTIIPEVTSKRVALKHKGQAIKKRKITKAESPSFVEESAEEKRHRGFRFRSVIQKGLIQRKTEPTEEELENVDITFKELEEYSPNVDFEFLKHSKLHKVLKVISKLDKEPSEDLQFQKRSQRLLIEWEEPIIQVKREKDVQRDTPNLSVLDSHHDIKRESSVEPSNAKETNDTDNSTGKHKERNGVKNE